MRIHEGGPRMNQCIPDTEIFAEADQDSCQKCAGPTDCHPNLTCSTSQCRWCGNWRPYTQRPRLSILLCRTHRFSSESDLFDIAASMAKHAGESVFHASRSSFSWPLTRLIRIYMCLLRVFVSLHKCQANAAKLLMGLAHKSIRGSITCIRG